MSHPSWPEGYVPLNGCSACGRDFGSLHAFDVHRTGTQAFNWSLDRHGRERRKRGG